MEETRDSKGGNRQRPLFEEVLGFEELNLVEFPLAVLASRPPQGVKTLRFEDWIRDKQSGQRVNRKVLVSAPDAKEVGLPTYIDVDVLLAMMRHTVQELGEFRAIVPFSIHQICKQLRWPHNGTSYERAKQALRTWNATWIRFENSFRRGERWTTEEGFHLISYYELTNCGEKFDEHREQTFEWHRLVVESVRNEHTKPLDWDFYLSLHLPSTRRLYRFLDKRFYARDRYTPDLVWFCQEKMGMSRGYKPGRYRDLLEPAIAELVEKRFLADCSREKRFQEEGRGIYRVEFRRVTRRHRQPAAVVQDTAPTGLVFELAKRGVEKTLAERLVESHPSERIQLQIEYHDDEQKRGKKVGPGRLYAAIEKDFTPPKGFQSTSEKRAAQVRKDAQAAAKHRELVAERQKVQEERTRREQLRLVWVGLSEAERDSIRESVFAEQAFLRGYFRRNPESTMVAVACYDEMVRRQADLE